MARTTTSIPTWTAVCLTMRPTEMAMSSTPTRTPKPRLSERSRHFCTAGRSRETSQKRTIGSPTHTHQTAIQAKAIAVSTAVGTFNAWAARMRTLAATNEAAAATCQRRGRGMIVSRYRSSA
jgi:hypothetical protein